MSVRLPRASDSDVMRSTAADTRLRTGRASASGKTKTAVPALFSDWKKSVLDATARDAARAELWPEVEQALARAQAHKGTLLEDHEAEKVADAFFDSHAPRVDQLHKKHTATFGHSTQQKDTVIARAVDDARPHIAQRRDPFTPIAHNDPQARAREVVLWENADAMVLVDLFVKHPKALVVPKAPVSFPCDAPAGMLEDLARIAAHVSDAFMAAAGAKKPAGIWVNPPQDLTVKQLHVHVMPDLPAWLDLLPALDKNVDLSGLGLPGGRRPRAVDLARDAQARPAMNTVFAELSAAIERTLGPST